MAANAQNISVTQPSSANVHIIKKNKYSGLQDFLIKHRCGKKSDKSNDNLANVITNAQPPEPEIVKQSTHTRIGDDSSGIYGGNYHIPDEDYDTFMRLYHKEVIAKKTPEYLTEKQLTEPGTAIGPIAVDIDLHFALDLPERVYTQDHLDDLIDGYLAVLKDIYQFDENSQFSIFMFEKTAINRVPEKKITKDGIHIIIGIQMDHTAQRILRDKMIPIVSEMWGDFPITNKWSDVFDEGISIGHTNWQLYGSRKPHHEAYKLTQVYEITFDPDDGELINTPGSIAEYLTEDNFMKLSVRYNGNPHFFYKASFIQILSAFQSADGNANSALRSRRSSGMLNSENMLMSGAGGGGAR